MQALFLCVSLVYALAIVVQGQGLASGWSKAHADLRNSNVHPSTGGIRSLHNTEYVALFEAEWKNGGAAHDQHGNSYFPAIKTLYQLNRTGDWNSAQLQTAEHFGTPALSDDGKVLLLSKSSLDLLDLDSHTVLSTSWSPLEWTLHGSSATVVEGMIYVLNSNGELMAFDFDLQLQASNGAARLWPQVDNFVEFCTPATDGQGNFFYFSESDESGTVFAVRLPENELRWNRSMTELDPLPSLNGLYNLGGAPSLSEDSGLLFVPLVFGGVVALDASNGEVVWATAIGDGYYYAEKQVPTISPLDGTIVTHWQESQNDSLVVVGLDPHTGEQVHFLKAFEGSISSSSFNSPGATSADGVYYLSVPDLIVAVDLENFEVMWHFSETKPVSFQSISIAADGSVYFPLNWEFMAVLRCKANFVLDATGTCSNECAHPKARLIGRNLCGYDCGDSVQVLFPLVEPRCGACQAGEYWSTEELVCQYCPAGLSSPAGSIGADSCVEDGSGSTRVCSLFARLLQ
ncbi:hypothetical protein QOT17_003333 [Balamuthia mandrillaris]